MATLFLCVLHFTFLLIINLSTNESKQEKRLRNIVRGKSVASTSGRSLRQCSGIHGTLPFGIQSPLAQPEALDDHQMHFFSFFTQRLFRNVSSQAHCESKSSFHHLIMSVHGPCRGAKINEH